MPRPNRQFVAPSLAVLLTCALSAEPARSEQTATMSVTVVATGEDATRSNGEWSKGTFTYRASLKTTLVSDGVQGNVNMYDPDYATKMAAQAARDMARIQDAMRGVFHEDDEETLPDDRFLLYVGDLNCPLALELSVEERLEGAYADVGGMQPYTRTFSARSTGTQAERDLLCVGSNLVHDVEGDVVYRSGLGFPEVTGHYVWHEPGRGNLQDNPTSRQAALPAAVAEHVFATLRVAPARGTSRRILEPAQPVISRVGQFDNYSGTLTVELTWDFETSD